MKNSNQTKSNSNQLPFSVGCFKASSTNGIYYFSASKLKEVWDYRSEGLTIDKAKNLILECKEWRKSVRDAKPKPKAYTGFRFTDIWILKRRLETKRYDIAKWDSSVNGILWDFAGEDVRYNGRIGKIYDITWINNKELVNANTYVRITNDLAAVLREDVDWDRNYYSRSSGWVKKTVDNRRIEFQRINRKTGKTEIVFTHHLDAWRGNFGIEALAAFLGVGKVKVHKELKSVQLNPFFDVVLDRKIGGVKVYRRMIGEYTWDYCALYHGTTFHASTKMEAVKGLRNKIEHAKKERETNLALDSEIITIEKAKSLRFCDEGINAFIADNGLDAYRETGISRKELREIVLKQRALNCGRYSEELDTLKIKLNCKS